MNKKYLNLKKCYSICLYTFFSKNLLDSEDPLRIHVVFTKFEKISCMALLFFLNSLQSVNGQKKKKNIFNIFIIPLKIDVRILSPPPLSWTLTFRIGESLPPFLGH